MPNLRDEAPPVRARPPAVDHALGGSGKPGGAGGQVPLCLDHNAATPARPLALRAYCAALAAYPAAPGPGCAAARRARRRRRTALARLAACLGVAPDALVATAGGTLATAAALQGFVMARPPHHVLASRLEHPAVAATLARLADAGRIRLGWVAPRADGVVAVADVLAALRPDTALVALTAASHETGAVQPTAALGACLRARGVALHVDATQAVGRLQASLPALGADLASFAAHKLGAPAGLGIAYVRPGLAVAVPPWLVLEDCVAALVALAAVLARPRRWLCTARSRDRLEAALVAAVPGLRVLAAAGPRLPQTSALVVPGCPGDGLLMALDVAGFAVSAGPACSAGAAAPSPALLAMGLSAAAARSSLRLSLGGPLAASARRRLVATLAGAAALLRQG